MIPGDQGGGGWGCQLVNSGVEGTREAGKRAEPHYHRLSRVKRKSWVYAAKLLAEVSGDQFAVKAPILNEDFTRLRSGDDHSGNVDSRNIRFQILGIANRTKLVRRKFDPHAAEEIEVWMVPSKREHEIVFQTTRSGRSSQRDIIAVDFLHRAVEVRDDFARLDAVLDVGTHPILDVVVNLRSSMDQSDASAVPPQIQSHFGRGILAANDNDVRIEIRMRFPIVMEDFLLVLAGDIELVSEIIVAGGEHDLARTVIVDGVVPVGCGDTKITVLPCNRLHPLILVDRQVIMFSDTAVIFERFEPRGLRQRGGERNIANLEQLRRGEEHHVARIAIDGIDQASLVDDERFEASLLSLYGAGHSGGTSAHDQDISPGVGPRLGLSARQSFRNLVYGQGQECWGLHRA